MDRRLGHLDFQLGSEGMAGIRVRGFKSLLLHLSFDTVFDA